ncbi:MAG: PAS domain S-box protein [Agriterribacter sp.]
MLHEPDIDLEFDSRRKHNRSSKIINYFGLITITGLLLIIIIRFIISVTVSGSNINNRESTDFLIAIAFALIPVICNYYGKMRLAIFFVSWLPPIVIIGLYTMHGLRNGGHLLTSEFTSVYLFLLSAAAVPYLLGTSNKRDFIVILLLPTLLIVFCDVVFKFFGVTELVGAGKRDVPQLYRMRAFVACFILNGCCFAIKRIIDKQDALNETLIEKLVAQNVLINQQAKEKITESRNKYQQLFEQATDAIILFDEKGRIDSVNLSAGTMFGYSAATFSTMGLPELLAEQNSIDKLEFFGNPHDPVIEMECKKSDGTVFPAEVNGKKLPDNSYQLFIKDITVRKNAQNKLREAEGRFRALVEQSLAGVYIIREKKFTYVNPQFAAIFGYSASDLDNHSTDILNALSTQNDVAHYMEEKFSTSTQGARYEMVGHKKNGQVVNVEIFGCSTIINGKPAVIGTLIDVTKNKLLQKRILEQREQEQKKIMRAMLKAEEKERNRLGRELHDNVNQILTGIKLSLTLASGKEQDAKLHINTAIDLVDNAIYETRALSHRQVMPLSEINLEELVFELVKKTQLVSPVKINFVYNIDSDAIKDDLKINLYRIIQEQLNNILKHAEAMLVDIIIEMHGGIVSVMINDDGKGFNTTKKSNGIGLSNITNRVESFDGKVKITSSPGNGCSLEIQIPV